MAPTWAGRSSSRREPPDRSGPRALALAALAGAARGRSATGALTVGRRGRARRAPGTSASTGSPRSGDLERRPERAERDRGRDVHAGQDRVPDGRLSPVHEGLREAGRATQPGNEGIQGPLLRARVGDTLLVHFRNLDTLTNQPHSMHFHGVRYRFGSDGAYIPGSRGRARTSSRGRPSLPPGRRAELGRASGRTTTTRRR